MPKVFTITEGLENMGALKSGGQGSVYKARRMGEIVSAVKLLPTPIHSENPADKNFIDFQNEVAKLKKVNEQPNPNVVKIFSSGVTDTGSFPFIEMEFIEGPDLEELLRQPDNSVFTIKEVIKVADQLSNALAHCHRVNVKHGDIKSNNVKYNIHTGNYVLLDFGLAVMSDEQRRTSLRQAGAIEFMAPEQYEGQMLFQTDVYSFGVVLFELLAGVVPFPLKDRTESARNAIRLDHLEKSPPDILALRGQQMPASWSEEKKERELLVPHWLLDLVYRCLQKQPQNRFATGIELHEYVILNSTLSTHKKESSATGLQVLQQENSRLLQEKDQLQRLLSQYQETANAKEQELVSLRVAFTRKERELQDWKNRPQPVPPKGAPVRRGVSKFSYYVLLFFTVGLGLLSIYLLISQEEAQEPRPRTTTATPVEEQPVQRSVIGQYKVLSDRAYFHNEPDGSTRRNAYLLPSNETIDVLEERNGFLYTEFTNSRGQTSKGWLRKEDLLTRDEWEARQNQPQEPLTKIEINRQLQEARTFLNNNNIEAALSIYKPLSEQNVPEAQFEFSNLALKNETKDLNCDEAQELLQKAAEENYTPAKRTLGFLLLFANNKQILRASGYGRCKFEKNLGRGSRLLLEAAMAGDTSANKLLDLHRSDSTAESDESFE